MTYWAKFIGLVFAFAVVNAVTDRIQAKMATEVGQFLVTLPYAFFLSWLITGRISSRSPEADGDR